MKHWIGILIFIAIASLTGCASSAHSESTGQYLDSTTLTTKVKMELLATKSLPSRHIHVTTYKNTVQLSGFLNTQEQINKAIQVTESVSGVKKVVNSLMLRAMPTPKSRVEDNAD